MILSKKNISNITSGDITVPQKELFSLAVRVMQFGTGVLLRGLPGYLIDKANGQGIFNGRIVVVKSTSAGDVSSFEDQDCLYTLLIRGVEDGREVKENVICSSISHVLTASLQWDKVLAECINPDLKVIISNTTEVGIQLVEEAIGLNPPASFPAKLLAILYKRYQVFNGDLQSGFVIIPTELIPDNGRVLKNIMVSLIAYNKLEPGFTEWFHKANHFCNSLVDRIVPGKPDVETQAKFKQSAGYTDNLATTSEVYRLWAIEGDDEVRSILSFERTDPGIVIAPDITLYRELKLRLLNGAHTLSCALAFLSGFDTVTAAVNDAGFLKYLNALMSEISEAIPYTISEEKRTDFINKVIDRFKNPFIHHQWINISQQYTAKLKLRVVPVLLQHYKTANTVPQSMATGFAAYILFMQCKRQDNGYVGFRKGEPYNITDEQAAYFCDLWGKVPDHEIVRVVLSNQLLWGTDLAGLPGFAERVQSRLSELISGSQII